jgi:hypothetical protein
LAQLVSASAQRRASQNKTCEGEINALLNHALGLVAFFLEGGRLPTFLPVRQGFPPFGAGIAPSGDLVDFNCLPIPGNPGALRVFCLPDQLAMFSNASEEKSSPQQLHDPPPMGAFVQAMKECAAAGGIHAAALVGGAGDPPGPARRHRSAGRQASAASLAIRVQLEHVEADPAIWYLPYRISDRKVVRGDLTRVAGQSLVFADLGPARHEAPRPAIAALLVMLGSDATRLDALSALAARGGEALPAVPRLIELLRDEDQQLVTKALRTLEAIGPAANEAVPALVELADDEDYLIRLHARAALKVISPAAASGFG